MFNEKTPGGDNAQNKNLPISYISLHRTIKLTPNVTNTFIWFSGNYNGLWVMVMCWVLQVGCFFDWSIN